MPVIPPKAYQNIRRQIDFMYCKLDIVARIMQNSDHWFDSEM